MTASASMVDAEAHQLDVIAPQCPQPTAVVLQGAFAGGRVVGKDLCRQFLVPSSWLVIHWVNIILARSLASLTDVC